MLILLRGIFQIFYSMFLFGLYFPSVTVFVDIVVDFLPLVVLCIHTFFILFPPFHPLNHFFHPFDSFPVIILDLHIWHVMIGPSELSPENPLQFFPVFLLDILHVLPKRLLLIFLIDVDSIIDQFLQLLVKMVAILFLRVIFLVDGLDMVIVVFIVRPQLGLLLEKLLCTLELLLTSLLLLLDYHRDLAQFLELRELQGLGLGLLWGLGLGLWDAIVNKVLGYLGGVLMDRVLGFGHCVWLLGSFLAFYAGHYDALFL